MRPLRAVPGQRHAHVEQQVEPVQRLLGGRAALQPLAAGEQPRAERFLQQVGRPGQRGRVRLGAQVPGEVAEVVAAPPLGRYVAGGPDRLRRPPSRGRRAARRPAPCGSRPTGWRGRRRRWPGGTAAARSPRRQRRSGRSPRTAVRRPGRRSAAARPRPRPATGRSRATARRPGCGRCTAAGTARPTAAAPPAAPGAGRGRAGVRRQDSTVRAEIPVRRRVQVAAVRFQRVAAELLDVDHGRRGQPLRAQRVGRPTVLAPGHQRRRVRDGGRRPGEHRDPWPLRPGRRVGFRHRRPP